MWEISGLVGNEDQDASGNIEFADIRMVSCGEASSLYGLEH